ncbi:MAG: zinc ribbon domain-containing protein [Magnetococcus sp. DMHC-6]
MPLYDYKCDACGIQFEREHRMSAPSVSQCPSCGAHKVRKLLTTGGIMGSTKLGQPDAGPPPNCGGGSCATGACPYN